MDRRQILRLSSLVLATLAGLVVSQTISRAEPDLPTLRERLEKGLKARLPNEFEFLDTVVTMVDAGTLPRELVDKVFFYVRREKSHKKYLVPYFERLLRAKAREQGIEIP